MAKKGRSTVYNNITSEEKLKQVNQDNLDLEEDYLDYLRSVDRAKTTIYQYQQNLRVFWCWNLEFNKNKFFVDLTKREISEICKFVSKSVFIKRSFVLFIPHEFIFWKRLFHSL